jgi:HAMP domain-containing protein
MIAIDNPLCDARQVDLVAANIRFDAELNRLKNSLLDITNGLHRLRNTDAQNTADKPIKQDNPTDAIGALERCVSILGMLNDDFEGCVRKLNSLV